MAKYHITKKGEPGVCRATKACPLGDESNHYESKEEASEAFEASQKNITPTVSKNNLPPVALTGDDRKRLVAEGWMLTDNGVAYSEEKGWPRDVALALRAQDVPRLFDTKSSEISAALEAAPTYKKVAVVTFRVAEPGEAFTTTLADGTVETERVLEGGEHIVKNPNGEEYAMSPEKFASRYFLNEKNEWQAMGEVKAVKNPTGAPITIMAPWGEKQHGGKDCYIAMNPTAPEDRYIIGGDEFANTYQPK